MSDDRDETFRQLQTKVIECDLKIVSGLREIDKAVEQLHKLMDDACADARRLEFIERCGARWSVAQMRVAFAYPVGMTLREGIDAAMRGDGDDAMT